MDICATYAQAKTRRADQGMVAKSSQSNEGTPRHFAPDRTKTTPPGLRVIGVTMSTDYVTRRTTHDTCEHKYDRPPAMCPARTKETTSE